MVLAAFAAAPQGYLEGRREKQVIDDNDIILAGREAYGNALRMFNSAIPGATPLPPQPGQASVPAQRQPGPPLPLAAQPMPPGGGPPQPPPGGGAAPGGFLGGVQQFFSSIVPGAAPSPGAGPSGGAPMPLPPPPGGQPQPQAPAQRAPQPQGGGAAPGGQPAGQFDWRQIVQAVVAANPGARPEVVAAAVDRAMPLMNAASQAQWREERIAMQAEQIRSREEIAQLRINAAQRRLEDRERGITERQARAEEGRNARNAATIEGKRLLKEMDIKSRSELLQLVEDGKDWRQAASAELKEKLKKMDWDERANLAAELDNRRDARLRAMEEGRDRRAAGVQEGMDRRTNANISSREKVAQARIDAAMDRLQFSANAKQEFAKLTYAQRRELQEYIENKRGDRAELSAGTKMAVAELRGDVAREVEQKRQEAANARNAATNAAGIQKEGMRQEGAAARTSETNQTRVTTEGMRQEGAMARAQLSAKTKMDVTRLSRESQEEIARMLEAGRQGRFEWSDRTRQELKKLDIKSREELYRLAEQDRQYRQDRGIAAKRTDAATAHERKVDLQDQREGAVAARQRFGEDRRDARAKAGLDERARQFDARLEHQKVSQDVKNDQRWTQLEMQRQELERRIQQGGDRAQLGQLRAIMDAQHKRANEIILAHSDRTKMKKDERLKLLNAQFEDYRRLIQQMNDTLGRGGGASPGAGGAASPQMSPGNPSPPAAPAPKTQGQVPQGASVIAAPPEIANDGNPDGWIYENAGRRYIKKGRILIAQ